MSRTLVGINATVLARLDGGVYSRMTFVVTDANGNQVATFGLNIPRASEGDDMGVGEGSTFAFVMQDIVAVTSVAGAPHDATAYTGAIAGKVVPQYFNPNVVQTVKLYSTHSGTDTHIAGGDATVAADGSFSCSAASNPLTAGSTFTLKLFDAASNQVGLSFPSA